MLLYIDGLYLKHLAQVERKVKRQILDQIRWDSSRVPLPGDRYEKPIRQRRRKKRSSRPGSVKSSSTKTSRSTRTNSEFEEPKRKPRSVNVDWGRQAKSLAVDLGENPRSFSLGIGPINPGRRKYPPRSHGGGGGLQIEQEDGTNVLVQSGEGTRRGTTNVEINKGRGDKKRGTKIKIDSSGKDRSEGSTTVSVKNTKKETPDVSHQGGTDIKVKSYGKDITIKNATSKRHPKESTKIDIKHGSGKTERSEESTQIDIQQDSNDDDWSENEAKARQNKRRPKSSKRLRPSSKGSATSSKTTSTNIDIQENSDVENFREEERNGRQSRIGDLSKRNTRVIIQNSDEEEDKEGETDDKRNSVSSADEDQTPRNDVKNAFSIGTQTTWMDTEPDPPPIMQMIPKKQTEHQGVRKVKYFGEKSTHYEYKHNHVETKERDEDDLVISISEPVDPEPIRWETPKKVKPEIIHYIDCEPQDSIDTYDPVFVKPLPIPKPTPKRPHITHPLVKVGGGWMRPSDYQHSRIPLEVQQHEQPVSKNKYLVIKSRPAPRPEPSPVYYRQFEKHSAVWPMYYPVRQAWGH